LACSTAVAFIAEPEILAQYSADSVALTEAYSLNDPTATPARSSDKMQWRMRSQQL
jgi:hypothetical protein